MKDIQYDDFDLLTTTDLQRFLNVGRDKARELMHNKTFPSKKIGKTYYVTFVNLKKWLTQYN